jgi:hypothetical protein
MDILETVFKLQKELATITSGRYPQAKEGRSQTCGQIQPFLWYSE